MNKSKKIVFLSLLIISIFSLSSIQGFQINLENKVLVTNQIILPKPNYLDISFEESLMKRMSVRDFSDQNLTDKDLSTVLYHAYKKLGPNLHTVPKINKTYCVVIYVILEDGVYTYNPENHSLIFYKEGDYRDDVSDKFHQYWAPVQIGLCYNTDICNDRNYAAAQCGAIGQNIYLAAFGLGLGTVITTETPEPAITPVGIPKNHKGICMMPLGHPLYPYNHEYRPFRLSFLPKIKCSNTNLSEAILSKNYTKHWSDESLSRKDIGHLTWASYGYSYYIDKSQPTMKFVKRYHTVPSCHGFYPFRIYIFTQTGIYRYIYGLTTIDRTFAPMNFDLIGRGIPSSFLLKIARGDHRSELADVSDDFIKDAPFSLITVLDIRLTNLWDDLSALKDRWNWYYEAGASSYNVLLEAKARNLTGTIFTIEEKKPLCEILKLDSNRFDPMFIVSIGNKKI